MSGKSIVGGILGGWLVIDGYKAWAGVKTHTGDVFALPMVLAIAIGRVGCFLTGLDDATYGFETSCPLGVDFGDGLRRHPTQLYEIAFLVVLGIVLFRRSRRPFANGVLWRLFGASYLAWRVVIDHTLMCGGYWP